MQEGECDRIAHKITKIYADQMFKEKKLIAVGTGGGADDSDMLRLLSVTFQTNQKHTLEEARILLIECIEKYLEIINNYPGFEKRATNFPFTNKNLKIVVLFEDRRSGHFIDPPFLAYARYEEEKFSYCTYPNKRLKTIHKETYEEALERAKR